MAPTSTVREALEERFSQLLADLESWFETDSEARIAAAARRTAEHLNQTVRRMRDAADFASLATVVLDGSVRFCNGAAVFRVTQDDIRGERSCGAPQPAAGNFQQLHFPPGTAPAFRTVIETMDPVVAVATRGELSAEVAEFFAHAAEDHVHLFPIASRDRVEGILYSWGEPQTAMLELLAQLAGIAWQSRVQPAPAKPAGLVAIEPAAAPEVPAPSPAEQRRQLQAQRFARVQVAEMRLYGAEAVRKGLASGDLYGAIRESVDAAREAYRRNFLAGGAALTDYLHEELLHSLAHDDAALLGKEYPGPLA